MSRVEEGENRDEYYESANPRLDTRHVKETGRVDGIEGKAVNDEENGTLLQCYHEAKEGESY